MSDDEDEGVAPPAAAGPSRVKRARDEDESEDEANVDALMQ